MRRIDWLAGCLALVAGVAAGHAVGCSNGETDCASYPDAMNCVGRHGRGQRGVHGDGIDGDVVDGHDGDRGRGRGSAPAAELRGPPVAPTTVKGKTTGNILDECAVFVSPTSTAATPDGSMANPYKTIATALFATSGSKNKVFACKSGAFTEALTLAVDVEVYGGFDCTTDPTQWTWAVADRSELDGPADAAALTIMAAADGALVSGFTIKGAAPASMTMGSGRASPWRSTTCRRWG